MFEAQPMDVYYTTDENDPPADYDNLTLDPASADHIFNNTCEVVDIRNCGNIWINQATYGPTKLALDIEYPR